MKTVKLDNGINFSTHSKGSSFILKPSGAGENFSSNISRSSQIE
jgi:hypothetical protein